MTENAAPNAILSAAPLRRLRVVHVYKGYPPVRGGIEGHVDLLTRLLVRAGVDAEVLCADAEGAPREERLDAAPAVSPRCPAA
jgi:hypothetical protein